MSGCTPEDVATVCKMLLRLRTGEMNLIPAPAGAEQRDRSGKGEAMLSRVEQLLTEWLRKHYEPIDNGGPAFPRDLPNIEVPPEDAVELIRRYDGMSLLDWFAGKSLEGDMASQSVETGEWSNTVSNEALLMRSKFHYRYAAAMVKARQS